MEEFLLFWLLSTLVGICLWGIAATAWVLSGRLTSGMPPGQTHAFSGWDKLLGWLLAWVGTVWLMGTTLYGGVRATVNDLLVTPFPIAILVAIVTTITVIIVVRSGWTIQHSLQTASLALSEEETPPSVVESLRRWAIGPLGLTLSLALICAILTAGVAIAILIFEGSDREFESVGCLLATMMGVILAFSGLAMVTAAEVTRLPEGTLSPHQQRGLIRVLRGLMVFFGFLGLLGFGWMGIILGGILVIIVISTLGGRWRAGQLSSFWTVAHVLRSGRPVAAEMLLQAQVSRGRTRSLLKNAAYYLERGEPIDETLSRLGVAPLSAWLELSAATSANALPASLQECAARETEKFARQGTEGTPRMALGYFCALGMTCFMTISFIGYYIVPKIKKIFEDFDMELPESTQLLFSLVDNSGLVLLSTLAVIAFVMVMAVGEVMVSFYGWQGMLDRLGGIGGKAGRTADLLRGLRWAVIKRVPLDTALLAMARAPVGFGARSKLHQAATVIEQGHDPWETLQRTGWLSAPQSVLLQTAQATGNLPWALETLSESIVARSEYRLQWWLQILHPAIVILVGCVVGFFALGMLMPLFSLINGLS